MQVLTVGQNDNIRHTSSHHGFVPGNSRIFQNFPVHPTQRDDDVVTQNFFSSLCRAYQKHLPATRQ